MDSLDKSNLKDLQSFFKNRAKEIKDEKDDILSIIGPHLESIDKSSLSEIDKSKNKKELIDLGKFLKLYDNTISIEEAVREAPDFLVRRKQNTIGVELSDIYTDVDAKKTEGTIDKIFREIENELIDSHPEIKGVFKIIFKDNTSFKIHKQEIKNTIINYLKTSVLSSEYVKSIDKSPGDSIFLYTAEASVVGPLNKEVVLEALAKKENKYAAYKSTSKVTELWLIFVLGGLKESSDYSFIDKSIIDDQFQTRFDKVFIVDFFGSKIIKLNTNN